MGCCRGNGDERNQENDDKRIQERDVERNQENDNEQNEHENVIESHDVYGAVSF